MSRSSDQTSDALRRDPSRVHARGGADEVDKIVSKFTKTLPSWLRRCGVRQTALADAVQEALVVALVRFRESPNGVPTDDAEIRRELMRIVSYVALRSRRQAQRDNDRYTSIENVEMPTGRDEEACVEARVVVLAALENLDEPTRALIFAHEIEGQTNGEIAATLGVKEDAIEKRVFFAKQRLRAEIEHIERGWTTKRPSHDGMLLGIGFDSIDPIYRALVGAMYDVLGKKPMLSSGTNTWSFVKPNFPTAILAGTLALAPNSSLTSSTYLATEGPTVRQEKHVASVDVPRIEESGKSLAGRDSGTPVVSFVAFAQGYASSPSSPSAMGTRSKVEPSGVVEAPAAAESPEVETNDVSDEENARRERLKVWGGSNTPFVDDP